MIQLVELVEAPISSSTRAKFSVREIYISPEHIVMAREDNHTEHVLRESNEKHPKIPANMKFTKLTINKGTTGQDIIVLGSIDMIYEKIHSSRSKQLLRG